MSLVVLRLLPFLKTAQQIILIGMRLLPSLQWYFWRNSKDDALELGGDDWSSLGRGWLSEVHFSMLLLHVELVEVKHKLGNWPIDLSILWENISWRSWIQIAVTININTEWVNKLNPSYVYRSVVCQQLGYWPVVLHSFIEEYRQKSSNKKTNL